MIDFGWLGILRATRLETKASAASLNEVIGDYVAGAGLVINLLPAVNYDFFTDDSSAISADVENVAIDMRAVVLKIDHWAKIDGKSGSGQQSGFKIRAK